MSNKKVNGKELRHARYQSTGALNTNAKRKLERHLKKHPGDEQAQKALGLTGSKNVRKKPNEKGGWIKETLRKSLQFVPYLNSKGQVIPVRSVEQMEELLKSSLVQTGAITRSQAKLQAWINRFETKVPFRTVPVYVTKTVEGRKEDVLEWKHTQKLSNFKGKVKA